jgi:hypothetical protein
MLDKFAAKKPRASSETMKKGVAEKGRVDDIEAEREPGAREQKIGLASPRNA